VCPGTSSWNSIGGRTDNALANLRSAAENGLKHGARGYLTTDWGDNGHWQSLPISELGFALGAAYAWAWEANRADVADNVLTIPVETDVGLRSGNVYRWAEAHPSVVWMLHWPSAQADYREVAGNAQRRWPRSTTR
jgi:hypothetical protein